jgi:hypothetical protein
MSAVANSYPERIAGLVYMEAAYSYAFDNGKGANVMELRGSSRHSRPGRARQMKPASTRSRNTMSG